MLYGGALFLFDNKAGAEEIYRSKIDSAIISVPQGLSNYVVHNYELTGRIMVHDFDNLLSILGSPICIHLPDKYDRNVLYYNLCFFVPNMDVIYYTNALGKLTYYLQELEREINLLSDENQRQRLEKLLDRIFDDLQSNGNCSIKVTGLTTIDIRITSLPCPKRNVPRYLAPVLCFNPGANGTLSEAQRQQFDFATARVMPFVNGINTVHRISQLANVDISVVEGVVSELCSYSLAKLLPPFTYYARYAATPLLTSIWQNKPLLMYVCQAVRLRKSGDVPNAGDVYRFLLGFDGSLPLRDVVLRYKPNSLGIDERRLIQLAVSQGWLRRLYAYPCLVKDLQGGEIMGLPESLFSGEHCVEELYIEAYVSDNDFRLTVNQFLLKLKSDSNLVVLWK